MIRSKVTFKLQTTIPLAVRLCWPRLRAAFLSGC